MIDKIAGAEIHSAPFNHIIIDDFYDQETLDSIIQLYDDIEEWDDWQTAVPIIGLSLENSEMSQALSDKFGVDLSEKRFDAVLKRDHAGYYLRPHNDDPNKFLNILVFLGDDFNGTGLYSTDSTENRCDFEQATLIKDVEAKKNRALIWVRGDDTWHGVKAGTNDRNVLLMVYFNQ